MKPLKTLILPIVLSSFSFISAAQVYTDEVQVVEGLNGNVGIGTPGPAVKLSVTGQDVEFYSNTSNNSLWIGRNSIQNFKLHVNDRHGYIDYNQDEDENSSHTLYIRNLAGGTSSENDIRFHTSGGDRMIISATGRIGIGLVNPSGDLDVAGNLGIIQSRYSSNTSATQFIGQKARGSVSSPEQVLKGDALATFVGRGYHDGGAFSGAAAAITILASDTFTTGARGGHIQFRTTNKGTTSLIEKMRITDNGNVGIGTATPSDKLHVNGAIRIPKASDTDNASPAFTYSSSQDFLYDGQYINHYGFGFHDYNDGGEDGVNSYISGYAGVDFFSGGQNRIRINRNGNVGVGTQAPSEKLEVNGNVKVTGSLSAENISLPGTNFVVNSASSGSYFVLNNSSGSFNFWMGGTGSDHHMRIGTDVGHYGDAAMEIYQSYYGGASASPGIVRVNGHLQYGTISQLSDISLKQNIEPIPEALTKLQKLNGVTYQWKSSGEQAMGLIAQDVEKVFPELIHEAPPAADGTIYKSVEYVSLIAPMIEAIKTLSEEVESLKKEIERLKAEQQ